MVAFDEPLARLLAEKSRLGDNGATERLIVHLWPIVHKEAECFQVFGTTLEEREQVTRRAALKAALAWSATRGASMRTFVVNCCQNALRDEYRKAAKDLSRHGDLPESAVHKPKVRRPDATKAIERRLRSLHGRPIEFTRVSAGTELLVWRLRKVLPEFEGFDKEDPESLAQLGRQLAQVYLDVAARMEEGATAHDHAEHGYPQEAWQTIVSDLRKTEPKRSKRKRFR